jgi:hypothetical protein
MVVGSTTTYVIGAYRHYSCEFESQKNCSYHNVNKSVIDISWFDTSAGGLLVPEGIISTVVGVSALTWVIKYIYY